MALSFAFDASAETPQSTAAKRALIAQIMGTSKTPRNIGEGFSAIGDGIVANVLGGRAAEAEKAGQASADSTFGALTAMLRGQGGSTQPSAYGSSPSVPSTADAASIRAGLIERGLPEHVADGFLMNFQDESGLNPGINEQSPTVPGSRGGFGLYQLTGPRRVAYEQYAQQLGVDPSNVDAQLDFMMSELQGPEAQAYQSIMAAPDAGSAAAAIVNDFLRPAEEHRARRAAQYTGGAAPTQVAEGPDLAMLMEAAANPWLNDSQKSVINSMIAQQMQQQDPAYRLGLEKLGLEVEGMRNPQPDPGFRVLTPEEAAAMNLPDGAYQVGPDNKVYEIGAGGTTINNLGNIPAGYELITDPATGASRMQPIPGSPAALEQEAANNKDNLRDSIATVSSDTVVDQAAKARALIGGTTTGAGGWLMGNLPFTDAADMYRYVSSLKSTAAAENINQMRQSSPTGGALGNASDADIKLLQDKAGALDPASPRFPEMLDDYERTLLRIIHGAEAGDKLFTETRPGFVPESTQQAPGTDIDALLEKYQ